MRHKIFYMENPHTNHGDKKPWGLRRTNLNPLFEIKLHRFTLAPFFFKDLLSNTYNLIHIRNATVSILDLSNGNNTIFKKNDLLWLK